MDTTTTRRALLGSALLAPIAATVATLPAASPPSGFPRLIASWRAAEKTRQHHHDTIYTPIFEAWTARREAIPHVRTKTGFLSFDGSTVTHLSTADESAVATAQRVCRDRARWTDYEDYQATCAELVERVAQRERVVAMVKRRMRIDDAFQEQERLGDAAGAALDAVFGHSSTSLADVCRKLDLLDDLDGHDVLQWTDGVFADVRRLAGQEAQA